MVKQMSAPAEPAIWFPAIRAGTGVDVFTQRLCEALNARGIQAGITWLPHRAEYAPWSVRKPERPEWANITHVNTWLHRSLLPSDSLVVATMHHSVHDAAMRPFKNWKQHLYHQAWVRPMETWILGRADKVTSVSQHTANEVSRSFGIDSEVIYNGLDLKLFKPPIRRAPRSTFKLMYVGSWSARKGTDLLAPIMACLGDGFELAYTASAGFPTDSQLPENCRNIGRPDVNSLVTAYQQSDALLFPSRLEGFGQVAAEAMACGLPVVAGRNSALPEIVSSQATGFLVKDDDIPAYAAAIRRLRDDRDLWRRMSSAARLSTEQKFDVNRMTDRYLALYRQLLHAEIAAT
ncbi:glycosyltransferase family 4 protein [Xanthomonas cerealis pv. cerealis]|uniref:glycosyltransferase family 4 protein n=1 Tax=Xanthomonas cerealis TaxID=3390025 RepID=UPI001F46E778|nr:glycosyltransferase family 4 protein [Xanthomonas translucens]UKE70335.1 glycosyltransferase family 4 protein [Xanthomonas translucens pv. pistacia]